MLCDRARRARPLLGTLVEISLRGRGDEDLHESADRAFAQIERIHQSMSAHSTDSDVFRINSAPAGSVIPVAESTWRVLELAMDISDASDGVFDVTVGAAMRARGQLPALTERLPDAGATFRDIELLSDHCVRVHRALAIDLGGIAKGYAVDAAVDVLLRNGVSAGCVNAGGDLRVFGEEEITVQVRDPLQPSIARAQVRAHECALATSANYAPDSGFSAAGVVLDARCGEPVVAGRSASVRASRCAIADALAKCMLLLGDASAPLLARYRAGGFLLDGDAQLVFDGGSLADEAGQSAASQSGIVGGVATLAQTRVDAAGKRSNVRVS
jgi:thiamine biosynthesis lipoprotein